MRKPREEPPKRRLLKSKQCEKVAFRTKDNFFKKPTKSVPNLGVDRFRLVLTSETAPHHSKFLAARLIAYFSKIDFECNLLNENCAHLLLSVRISSSITEMSAAWPN